ncbi:MAG TPA: AI-2E family transporter [Pseudonocardia sp.]
MAQTESSEVGPGSTAMPRGLVVILGCTGLLVTTLALREFSSVISPVLLALVLVIGLHPLTGLLGRHGAPKWLAITCTLLALFAIILGLAVAFALSLAQLGAVLPTYQDRFNAFLVDLEAWLATLGIGQDQLNAALGQVSFGRVAGVVTDLLGAFAGAFSNLVLLLLVVLFMGLDATYFSRRLANVGGKPKAVVNALGDFAHGTRIYLVVCTVFGLIVALIDTTFLWIVGVPLALLWGLLAFVTNYIPNVGFIIGLVPPALLALLEGGPELMISVIAAYSVANFVIQSVIQPKFVGDAVNLSLTLTFLSLIFWSFAIGPLGAILAIPLTLLAKAVLLDVDPQTRWISGLLESGPADNDGQAAVAGDSPDRGSPAAPDASHVSVRRAEPPDLLTKDGQVYDRRPPTAQ